MITDHFGFRGRNRSAPANSTRWKGVSSREPCGRSRPSTHIGGWSWMGPCRSHTTPANFSTPFIRLTPSAPETWVATATGRVPSAVNNCSRNVPGNLGAVNMWSSTLSRCGAAGERSSSWPRGADAESGPAGGHQSCSDHSRPGGAPTVVGRFLPPAPPGSLVTTAARPSVPGARPPARRRSVHQVQ